MSGFLRMFFKSRNSLYITEFGHSEHSQPKTVGPWSREIYILHFVIKGCVDFSGFKANAGEAFLISKERLHSFTISEGYEHYWIGFDGEMLDTLFRGLDLEYEEHQLFLVEDQNFAENLFVSAYNAIQSESQEKGESIALSLLMSMLPLLKSEKKAKSLHKIDYAEKTLMFIKTNYMHPLKMKDIANDICISEKYMYRLFLERFKISPQQFLIKTRMEKALELLQQSNLSVTEVSCCVGYTSLAIFSKAFSNYFGVSPNSLKRKAITCN